MFSNKQCEIGRALTGDKTDDITINSEAATLSPEQVAKIFQSANSFAKALNGPFDKALPVNQAAFKALADGFNISAATLFCVFMEEMSEQKKKN